MFLNVYINPVMVSMLCPNINNYLPVKGDNIIINQ